MTSDRKPKPDSVAVIIPCYKVAQTIKDVVRSAIGRADHIIVIDDCCPEKSGLIVQELQLDSVQASRQPITSREAILGKTLMFLDSFTLSLHYMSSEKPKVTVPQYTPWELDWICFRCPDSVHPEVTLSSSQSL